MAIMLKEHRFCYMTTDTFALFRFGYGSVFHVPISFVWACFDGKRYLSTKVFLIRSFAREFSLVFFQFGRYSFSNIIHLVLKFIARRKRRRQTSSSCKYQISKCLSCKFSYYAFKKNWKANCEVQKPTVCSCVSGFFACDHNYNLRQRKTQL